MSQSGRPESEAVTVAAGFAVCRRHRNAIMTKDLGELIEQVLFETRPTPPPLGPLTARAMERGPDRFGGTITEDQAAAACLRADCGHPVGEHDRSGCRRCVCGRTALGALRP
jgi:hypothetical protein